MNNQTQHDMLVTPTHDEAARQDFVVSYRKHLASNVAPYGALFYNQLDKDSYIKKHGHEPCDRSEMREVMTQNQPYQFFSAMQRNAQEMVWDSVIDSVERELPDLKSKAARLSNTNAGSLTLDSSVEAPRYLTGYDIHLQPGGYHTTYGESDVAAGALYERAIYIYSMGQLGPDNDYLGRSLVDFYRDRFPDKTPLRILDMGCTTGNSATAWAREYPDAEIYGIDVGEALLRYGHARAEALGYRVHFSQQNAEATGFEDESFDIVMSHFMMHETSTPAVEHIYAESYRLLKPGGVMMHQDNPRFKDLPPLNGFLAAWEVYNNNESFGGTYRDMDLVPVACKAGFDPSRVRQDALTYYKAMSHSNYNTSYDKWPVLVGEK